MKNKFSEINVNNYLFIHLFLITTIFAIDSNFSIESKYGRGTKVNPLNAKRTPDYSYNEHIIDLNFNFDSGLYLYSQIEYSNPPIKGFNFTGINNYHLEYSSDKYSIRLGDIYGLYGRGLAINMFQDHIVDYDNSLKGIEFNYYLSDYLNLFFLYGQKEFLFRTSTVLDTSNLGLDNRAYLLGFEKNTDQFGSFHYLYLNEESVIDFGKYEFSEYFVVQEAYSSPNDFLILINKTDKDFLYTCEHNFSWDVNFFNTDFYIENSIVDYQTVNNKDLNGSKLYLSLYRDILGIGSTYEYKNYSMESYLQTLANPPIVYRESNSSLASRNSHSINWNDEIGHQFDFNKYINDMFNFEWNLSIAYTHKEASHSSGILDIIKLSETAFERNPFRQFYFGSSGWMLNNKLYYKIGFDDFNEIKSNDKKYIKAYTLPALFTYTLGENSITTYLESQIKINKKLDDNYKVKSEDCDTNRYLSFTFNYKGQLSLTYFYEDENVDNNWMGSDITYNINNTTQLSLFYGSQKGGLVCANGVCAIQPGLEDAVKLTFRSLF